MGDDERAGHLYEESVALARAAGDRRGVGNSLYVLGIISPSAARMSVRDRCWTRALADCGPSATVAYRRALCDLGELLSDQGDFAQARAALKESRTSRIRWGAAGRVSHGHSWGSDGSPTARATTSGPRASWSSSWRISGEDSMAKRSELSALHALGVWPGDGASGSARRSCCATGWPAAGGERAVARPRCLEGLAMVAVGQDRPGGRRACWGRRAGCARRGRAAAAGRPAGPRGAVQAARAALGEAAFAAAWAAGAALSLDEAVAEALDQAADG